MTYRGYSLLALLAAGLVLLALGLAGAGLWLEQARLIGAGLVCGLGSVTCAVLSVLDG